MVSKLKSLPCIFPFVFWNTLYFGSIFCWEVGGGLGHVIRNFGIWSTGWQNRKKVFLIMSLNRFSSAAPCVGGEGYVGGGRPLLWVVMTSSRSAVYLAGIEPLVQEGSVFLGVVHFWWIIHIHTGGGVFHKPCQRGLSQLCQRGSFIKGSFTKRH